MESSVEEEKTEFFKPQAFSFIKLVSRFYIEFNMFMVGGRGTGGVDISVLCEHGRRRAVAIVIFARIFLKCKTYITRDFALGGESDCSRKFHLSAR